MTRSLLSARSFAWTAAAAALAAVMASLTALPAAAGSREVGWKPCPEDPSFSCGTLTLPVDWSKPSGPSFELAVAKHPVTDPARRIGALFVNPGGPGGSGVDMALASGAALAPDCWPDLTS